MTTPTIPTIQKSWDDHVIDAIPTVVNTGWGITSAFATPLQKIGNWIWQKAGGDQNPVTTYWNTCTPKTQALAKKLGYGAVFLGVGAATATTVYPAIASLTGASMTGASVATATAAAATATAEAVAEPTSSMMSDLASAGLSIGTRLVTNAGISGIVGTGTTIHQLVKGDSAGVAVGKGLVAATATGLLASSSPLTKAAIAGTTRVGYELYNKQSSIKSAGIKAIVAATATGASAGFGGPLIAGIAIGAAETGRRLYNGESKTTALKMGLATGATSGAIAAIAGPGTLAVTAAGTAAAHSMVQDGTLKDVALKGLNTAALVGVGTVAAGALGAYAMSGAAAIAAPVAVATVAAAPVMAAATTSIMGGVAATAGAIASAGIGLTGAATIGTGAGLATALHSWLGNKDPLMTALGKGAGVGAAVTAGSLAMLSSAALGAGAAGLAAGSLALGATAMAANPGLVVHAHFPDGRGSSRLVTPGTDPLPKNPENALKELSGRVSKFRSAQPSGTFWEDPQIALIKELDPRIVQEASNVLEQLGPNPSDPLKAIPTDQAKIDALARVLAKAGIDPATVDIALVEKMEEVEKITGIRTEPQLYVERKKQTDIQINHLVENATIIGTIYTVHIYMMGFKTTDAIDGVTVWEKMQAITQEAKDIIANGKTPDLWAIYKKHLGKMYESNGSGGVLGWIKGTWKRVWAKLAYWAVHKWSTAHNAVNSFTKNVITEFRNTIESKNQEKLTSVFEKSFDQLGLLLDIHNDTAKEYANGGIASGTLDDSQKMAMNLMGDKRALQLDAAEQAKLDAKIMTDLCANFAKVLINKSLPEIKIVPWNHWGIWVGGVLSCGLVLIAAWGFEKWALRKVDSITDTLPYGIQNLVEMGLSQTMPNQYAFKKAIADSLTTQVEYLLEDMDVPSTAKPPRLGKSSFVDGTAKRILRAMKIRALGKNPTKEEIKALIEKMDSEPPTATETLLHGLLVQGSQIFMYYFSKKPEKMEKLFGDMLALGNMMFKPYEEGDEIPTEALYNDSRTRLKNATGQVITRAIQDGVESEIKGPVNQERLDQYIVGRKDADGTLLEKGLYDIQKDRGTRSFTVLNGLCEEMSEKLKRKNPDEGIELLKELDQYAETLGQFADQAKGMDIDLYAAPVQDAFYQTFHPIYTAAAPLATLATDLQKPVIQYDKEMRLIAKIEELIPAVNQPPTTLKKRLASIEEISLSHNQPMLTVSSQLSILRDHANGIEVASAAEEKERLTIEMLAKLVGKSGSIPVSYLKNPKANDREIEKWTRRIRAGVPVEDQEPLFEYIRQLYAAASRVPQGDLTPIQQLIDTELQRILQRHVDRKAEQIAFRTSSAMAFRTLAEQMLAEVTELREANYRQIKGKLHILNSATKKILTKIDQTKPASVVVPLSNLAPNAMKELQTLIGTPIEKKIEPYLDLAFDMITDHNVYEGTSRLLMKSVIAANQQH